MKKILALLFAVGLFGAASNNFTVEVRNAALKVSVFSGATCTGSTVARLSTNFTPPARFRVEGNAGNFSLVKE